MSATIVLTESEPLLTAVAGQRIPRRAWAQVSELNGLLSEAGRIVQTAKRQAELLQRLRTVTATDGSSRAESELAPPDTLDVAVDQFQKAFDRHVRVLNERLLGQRLLFVKLAHPPFDHLGDDVVGLA